MRGRLKASYILFPLYSFQSTPPCGGDSGKEGGRRPWKNFNPRPHAGATPGFGVFGASGMDFNPRPHAGATEGGRVQEPTGQYFNPRPHAGATLADRFGGHFGIYISIHAPMRGRLRLKTYMPSWPKFQSTPPCGGDCRRRGDAPRNRNFNPRPHAGATLSGSAIKRSSEISIHAPMRGRLSSVSSK